LVDTVAGAVAQPSRPEDAGAEFAADHFAVAPAGVVPVGSMRLPATESESVVPEDVVAADIADGGHAVVFGEMDGESRPHPAAASNRPECDATDIMWFPRGAITVLPMNGLVPNAGCITTLIYLLPAMYDDT